MFTIPPGAFYPKPKVHSATLLFEPRDPYIIEDWDFFEQVVRQSFKNRRKLLANNLAGLNDLEKSALEKIFQTAGLPQLSRAEQVTIDQFIEIARLIKASVLS